LTGRAGEESESDGVPLLCLAPADEGESLRDGWMSVDFAEGPAECESEVVAVLLCRIEFSRVEFSRVEFSRGSCCASSSDSVAESAGIFCSGGWIGSGDGDFLIG